MREWTCRMRKWSNGMPVWQMGMAIWTNRMPIWQIMEAGWAVTCPPSPAGRRAHSIGFRAHQVTRLRLRAAVTATEVTAWVTSALVALTRLRLRAAVTATGDLTGPR